MAVIEFINGENKTYGAMKRVIEYITNPAKTEPHLISGHNCDINNAYHQFVLTKRHFGKETGRQYIHFTQSFAPYDKVTPDDVKAIADELVQMEAFRGFQIAYAVHTDKDHLHTHFVVNTVNSETGLKWKQSSEQLQIMKDFSDDLCRSKGLIITEGNKGARINRGEYRIKEKRQSWKYELFIAVKESMRSATNKDEFISYMSRFGYQVDWRDKRKYITFTTPEGKKCRNRKLYPPERFTKENLLKTFEMNKQYQDKKILNDRIELLFNILRLLPADMNNVDSNYPLTRLEGEALNDKLNELRKGKGLDWDHQNESEL